MRHLLQLVHGMIVILFLAAAGMTARAADGGPPASEFANTYWLYCENSCEERVYWYRIHIRADGTMGYRERRDTEMIYDGTDRWKLVGPYLVLVWTDGASYEVYDVGTGGRQSYSGLHSEVSDISIIQRAPESGGTLPEP